MPRRVMTLYYSINGLGFISLFCYYILWRNTLCSISFLCSRSTPLFLLPSLHCLPGGRSLTLPWEVNDASSFLMTVGAFCYSLVQTVALCSALFPSSCRHVFHRENETIFFFFLGLLPEKRWLKALMGRDERIKQFSSSSLDSSQRKDD